MKNTITEQRTSAFFQALGIDPNAPQVTIPEDESTCYMFSAVNLTTGERHKVPCYRKACEECRRAKTDRYVSQIEYESVNHDLRIMYVNSGDKRLLLIAIRKAKCIYKCFPLSNGFLYIVTDYTGFGDTKPLPETREGLFKWIDCQLESAQYTKLRTSGSRGFGGWYTGYHKSSVKGASKVMKRSDGQLAKYFEQQKKCLQEQAEQQYANVQMQIMAIQSCIDNIHKCSIIPFGAFGVDSETFVDVVNSAKSPDDFVERLERAKG